MPGLRLLVGVASYHPQISNAPQQQLARYWGNPTANSAYAYYETLGMAQPTVPC